MNFSNIGSTLSSGMGYVAAPFVQAGRLASRVGSVASGALDWVLPRNPVSQCRQLRLIPTFVEVGIGRALYSFYCPSHSLCRDTALNTKVQEVFQRLVPHVDRKLPYEIRIIQDNQVANAYCLAGGKVSITTALLTRLDTDLGDHLDGETTFDDRLAAVLGHELTHAAAGHTAMGLQVALMTKVVGQLALKGLCLFWGQGKESGERVENTRSYKLASMGLNAVSAITLSQHSQSDELEADRKGMKVAARAGFNPAGGVWLQKMFLKMKGRETSVPLARVRDVLSSHPPSELRVQKAREALELFQRQGAEAL